MCLFNTHSSPHFVGGSILWTAPRTKKKTRIATEVLRHQRQHDGRPRTSQQSPGGGMRQAQRAANGDLKKMHGGYYRMVVMDCHLEATSGFG